MIGRRGLRCCLLLASGIVACAPNGNPAVEEPGSPLPGLRDSEAAAFAVGRALFDKVFTPQEGLGPMFNENQCSACHTAPASGGTSGFERVVRATRFDPVAGCDILDPQGGENVRSQATPSMKALGILHEEIPPAATEVGRFTPPSLFGLGLVEAIPPEQILAHADPDDRDGDGVSGRVGRTADGRLARFGRKAEFATVGEFIRSALRFEMGLTSAGDSMDAVNGRAPPPGTDPVAEPEVDDHTVAALEAFVRFLAPPRRARARSRAHGDTVLAGRRLFERLGCESCHTASMVTGPDTVPALRRQRIALYSDLLLHDMGPDLTDVCGAAAAPAEVRTELLMGLRYRSRYLHDGRTGDLREAILAHGGEARHARDAFAQLPWLRQEFVIIFLKSL